MIITKADIIGKIIQKVNVDETSCMAVAVLEGYGIGWFKTVEEVINNWVKISKEFEPEISKYQH